MQPLSLPYLANSQLSYNVTPNSLTVFHHQEPTNTFSSPFFFEVSAQDSCLNLLYHTGVIDEWGKLKEERGMIPLPLLNQDQQRDISLFTNCPIYNSYIQTFFEKLYQALPFANQNLTEAIGGFVRRLALSSPEYVLEALCLLTNLEKESLVPLLTSQLLAEGKRLLPDIDIRLHFPLSTREELSTCIHSVVSILSELSEKDPKIVIDSFFSKFTVVFNAENQFSIASFSSLELLFIKKLNRSHLFSIDGLRIPILNEQPLQFVSDNGYGWQSFIDLLTKTIHIESPETVDHYGFPLLASYFSQGYILGHSEDVLDILIKKSTTTFQYFVSIPSQLAGLLGDAFTKHHENSLSKVLTITANACVHFKGRLSSKEIASVWEYLGLKFWREQKEALPHLGVIGKIAETMLSNPNSQELLPALFAAVAYGGWLHLESAKRSSLVTVRQHMGSPALQIKTNDGTLLLPIQFEEAVSILETFLKNKDHQNQIEILLEIIESIVFQEECDSPLLSNSLIKESEKSIHVFIQNPSRPCQYLAYLFILMTNLKEPNSEKVFGLLENFILATGIRGHKSRTKIIDLLIQIVEKTGDHFLIDPLQKIEKVINETSLEKNHLLSWVYALIETQDKKCCTLALKLWEEHRNKYPFKQRNKEDIALINQLLPFSPIESFSLFLLFQQYQEGIVKDQEFETLNELIAHSNKVSSPLFATFVPRLLLSMSTTFTSGRVIDEGAKCPSDLLKNSIIILEKLLELGLYVPSLALWELLSSHPFLIHEKESLEKGWLLLAETALSTERRSFHEGADLWSRRKGLVESNNSFLQKKVFLLLTSKMLEKGEHTGLLKHLKILRWSGDSRIEQFVLLYIKNLEENNLIKKAGWTLETFYASFSKKKQNKLCLKLIPRLLEAKEWTLAANLWFLLSPEAKDQELTHNILNELTKENCSSLSLKLALNIFNKEWKTANSFSENTLIQIGRALERNPHPKRYVSLLHILLRHQSNLSHACQIELIRSLVSCLGKIETLSLRVVGRTFSSLPLFSRILMKSNKRNSATDLLNILGKNAISSEVNSSFKDLFDLAITNWTEQQNFSSANPTTLSLLKDYPPKEVSIWKKLFSLAGEKTFPHVWEAFNSWRQQIPQDENSAECWLQILKTIETFSPKELDILLIEFLERESLLAKTFKNETEWLQACRYFAKRANALLQNGKEELIKKLFNNLCILNLPSELEKQQTEFVNEILIEFGKVKSSEQLFVATEVIMGTAGYFISHQATSVSALNGVMTTLLRKVQNRPDEQSLSNLLSATNTLMFSSHINGIDLLSIAECLSVYTTKEPLEVCKKILEGWKSSNKSKNAQYNRAWSHYLTHFAMYQIDLKDPEKQKEAITLIIQHANDWKEDSAAFEKSTRFALHLISEQFSEKSFSDFFTYAKDFFRAVLGDNDSFTVKEFHLKKGKDQPEFSHLQPVTFNCTLPLNIFFAESRVRFFICLSSLTENILNLNFKDENSLYLQAQFIYESLTILTTQFPNQAKDIVNLTEEFVYKWPPSKTSFYQFIQASVAKLLKKQSDHFYSANPDKLFKMHIIINEEIPELPNFPFSKQPEAYLNLVNTILDYSTLESFNYLTSLLKKTQSFIRYEQPYISNCYQNMIKKLDDYSLPYYEKISNAPFNQIQNAFICFDGFVCLNGNEKGRQAATQLTTALFNKVWNLYIPIKNETDASCEFYTKILWWLGDFLLLSRKAAAFTERNGIATYLSLVEKYATQMTQDLPLIKKIWEKEPSDQENKFYTTITHAIIDKEYLQTPFSKYTNTNKEIRIKILSNWIIKLSVYSNELAKKQLLLAEGIFDGYSKLLKQLQTKINPKIK